MNNSFDDIIYNLGYELLEKQMNGQTLTEVEKSFLSHVVEDIDRQINELMNNVD